MLSLDEFVNCLPDVGTNGFSFAFPWKKSSGIEPELAPADESFVLLTESECLLRSLSSRLWDLGLRRLLELSSRSLLGESLFGESLLEECLCLARE